MGEFSDDMDIGGAGATGSLSEREGDSLSLLKVFEAGSVDFGAVEEQVIVAAVTDEAESLVSDQLDLALCVSRLAIHFGGRAVIGLFEFPVRGPVRVPVVFSRLVRLSVVGFAFSAGGSAGGSSGGCAGGVLSTRVRRVGCLWSFRLGVAVA